MIKNYKGRAKAINGYLIRSLALIMALVIAWAVTAFAAANESYTVDIYDGSEVTRVETSKKDANAIVSEAEISVSENDKLILNDFVPGSQSKIIICRESKIRFTDVNGHTNEYLFAGRVNEFLSSQGIEISDDTFLSVSSTAICYDGMEIVMASLYNVTVNYDGKSKAVSSAAANVGEMLSEIGITLKENDEVEPSLDTPISEGLTVNVLRVEYNSYEKEETISFTKKTEYSASMEKGTTKVTQKGVDGQKHVVYKEKIVNGKVVNTTVESEKEIVAPVPQITTVGTKTVGNATVIKNSSAISELQMPSQYTLDSNGIPTSYKYTISGRSAAYCIPGGTTSTGKKVKPGYVAVDPNKIPYGTKMYIVSDDGIVYGYAIAADTGSFSSDIVVDLYMNSTSQCYSWGSRNVTIYVLG
ncbi:MAG: G5 domain-containing protein [Oscillospiraceae bacterium]|nr:G5 domain-containing protein [Oscillospiraceae bacterium]